MHRTRKLHIAIDCRIADPRQGVGSAVLALAKGLSDSGIADQKYTFLVREDLKDWLSPYIYGPCAVVGIPLPKLSGIKSALRWIKPLKLIWTELRSKVEPVPLSDGYVESHDFDVVHFPTQAAYVTDIPSIYQPWDLQHLHYPQFFSKAEFRLRERLYRAFCERATFVCVQAQWTKSDVLERYQIREEKIAVIPWGSVFDSYKKPEIGSMQRTARKYDLPEQFFFYPAVTWPHKNHEVILGALHLLKNQKNITPHVFFTGASTEYRSTLDQLSRQLEISEQIHFLGFLTPEELQAVFGMATAMIFPSKFEGFGLPILEAFHAGLPVISSNATTLPEVAQDAALYFDPNAPEELAELMQRLLIDPILRQELARKGNEVLSQHSMKNTVYKLQALYERTFEQKLQSQALSMNTGKMENR